MIQNKTILLTGSTGYLGSFLKSFFLSKGYKLITAGKREDLDIYMDFKNPENISSKKINEQIDICIHVAGATETYSSIDASLVNVTGTKALLEFCELNNIRNFIFVSTMHVFGNLCGVLTERTEPVPNNEYGISNYLAEKYVEYYERNKSFNTSILRLSNLYGIPKNLELFNRWSLVPFAFVKAAIDSNNIHLKTSGEQIRNFLDTEDVAQLLIKLIGFKKYPALLHVYGPDDLSIYQFAQLVSRRCLDVLGIEVSVSFESIQERQNGELEQFQFRSNLLTDFYKPNKKIESFIDAFLILLQRNHDLL